MACHIDQIVQVVGSILSDERQLFLVLDYASVTATYMTFTRELLLRREIRGAISSAVILDAHDVRRMALLAATFVLQRGVKPRITRMSRIKRDTYSVGQQDELSCGWMYLRKKITRLIDHDKSSCDYITQPNDLAGPPRWRYLT
jgi:hypothetical protein